MEENRQNFLAIVQKYNPDFSLEKIMNEESYTKLLKKVKKGYIGAERQFQIESLNLIYGYLINKLSPETTLENFENAISQATEFALEWYEKLCNNNLPKVSKDWQESIKKGKFVSFEKYKKSIQKYVKTKLYQEDIKEQQTNAYLYYGWEKQTNIEMLPDLSIEKN